MSNVIIKLEGADWKIALDELGYTPTTALMETLAPSDSLRIEWSFATGGNQTFGASTTEGAPDILNTLLITAGSQLITIETVNNIPLEQAITKP